MRFTQDHTSSVNVIRGYSDGQLQINSDVFQSSIIVGASAVRTESTVSSISDLGDAHVAHILALDPELVLLGTGKRQVFPSPEFGVRFLRAGIGFEVMDTGAACRTFNVLVAEQRRVVAFLIV
jgi:uncharacterized protein